MNENLAVEIVLLNFALATHNISENGTELTEQLYNISMDRDESAASLRSLPPPPVTFLQAEDFLKQLHKQAPIRNTRSGTAVILSHSITCSPLQTIEADHHTNSGSIVNTQLKILNSSFGNYGSQNTHVVVVLSTEALGLEASKALSNGADLAMTRSNPPHRNCVLNK